MKQRPPTTPELAHDSSRFVVNDILIKLDALVLSAKRLPQTIHELAVAYEGFAKAFHNKKQRRD
jgi:hypothetical protein